MSGIRSRGRRGSIVVPNWRAEDPEIDPYAFRIACWLAGHADHYTESTVSRNLIAKVVRISRTKVSESIDALEQLGIIDVERVGDKARIVITFDFEVWEVGRQASYQQDATRPQVGRQASCTKGDPEEEQKAPAPAAPKTGDGAIVDHAKALVDAWWESLTPKPAQPYIAIVKVVQQCLKNGWSDELIASALREAPVVSGAAFDLWRNNREKPTAKSAVAAEVDKMLAWSTAFFEQRDLLAWRHEHIDALRETIRTLHAWGFDFGEIMLRIAVGARKPADMTNPTKLSGLTRVARFNGLPGEDLSECMERAYRNLGWRA